MRRVAVVGIGSTGNRSMTPDVSYKELMFEAATKAYEDAGVDPRRDVDGFVCCSEDYWEGYSIFDEFVPDQLGAILRPLCTVASDGLYGLITAHMQICAGAFDVVAVEAHSKASDMLTFNSILAFALDPIYNRPLGGHPYYVAGLEMMRYLCETGNTKEQCAHVVVKNRRNAFMNPYAAYGAKLSIEDVVESEPLFEPMSSLDVAPLADGCVVLVLSSEEVARKLTDTPIWIEGVGWASDTPWLESREWGRATYAELAGDMACKMAGIRRPSEEIDVFEIDDRFSYKELQHLEALRVCGPGGAGMLTEEGMTKWDGDVPVNASGGLLGAGYTIENSGLQMAMEIVQQLRGEAGRRQVPDAMTGLAQVWRGVPTASGAVAIMGRG